MEIQASVVNDAPAVFPKGVTVITWMVTDTSGNQATATQTVTVNDTERPTITCRGDKVVNADPLVCTAVVRDIGPVGGGDNCSGYTITYNLSGATSGSGSDDASGTAFNLGATTVSYTITDAAGLSASCSFSVTVINPDPVVTLTGPATGSLYPVNTPVSFTAALTDAAGGTHSGTWSFDAISQAAEIAESSGASAGMATATHTFTTAGVYKVKLTLNDSCGGSGTADQIGNMELLVVVYDPLAGYVTGGGWIDSKAGAKAQYKGIGQINGAGNYGFLLTATDGDVSGGGVDKFRIKIWDKSNRDAIVYDNALGASDDIDDANPQAIAGGTIVIHKER